MVARAVPNMLAMVGFNGYGTYLIFGSFCASMWISTWVHCARDKGFGLEKIDDLMESRILWSMNTKQAEGRPIWDFFPPKGGLKGR